MSGPILKAALGYAGRGWPVFPCNGKAPLTEHGFKDATIDVETIRAWWTKWPDANVAIATGAASGLVVLDVDGDDGGDSLAKLEREHGALPRTVSAKTPHGQHFYFAHPGGVIANSVGRLGAGLDVRADGGYVIAPPSPGREWDEHPDELALAAFNIDGARRNGGPAPAVGDVIPEHERNVTLTSLAGTMRRRGMSEAAIVAALQVENHHRCVPSLPDREVGRIAASVSRYPPSVVDVVSLTTHDAHDALFERARAAPVLIEHSVAVMLTTPPPPVEWLVDDLLVRGQTTMLAGREGQGKSMLALAIAVDNPDLRVVYIDAENGYSEIHRRVHGLGVAAGRLRYIEAERFHLGHDLVALSELLPASTDVVVLDSFRALCPGLDENDSAQVDPVLQALARLVRERKIAVLVLHHAGKGGLEYRGSTALGAGVGLGFTMRRHDDDPERATRREVVCWKCRVAPEPAKRWLSIELRVDGQLTVAEVEPYEPGDDLRAKILDRVKPDESVSAAQVARRLGRNERDNAVLDELKRLVGDGVFERPSKEKWRRASSASFGGSGTTKTTFDGDET
jgi:Bifunctional DNA primase/polymerase, N-terminal/AAA domain/Primase C terminal 1 (PriCT-1)